jgi:hypothetical protein
MTVIRNFMSAKISTKRFLQVEVRCLDCRHCGKVKGEQLDFLADNPMGHAQQLISRLKDRRFVGKDRCTICDSSRADLRFGSKMGQRPMSRRRGRSPFGAYSQVSVLVQQVAGSNPNYLLGAMLRNANSCRLGRSIVATPLLS